MVSAVKKEHKPTGNVLVKGRIVWIITVYHEASNKGEAYTFLFG